MFGRAVTIKFSTRWRRQATVGRKRMASARRRLTGVNLKKTFFVLQRR
jgi:hypothetical protein